MELSKVIFFGCLVSLLAVGVAGLFVPKGSVRGNAAMSALTSFFGMMMWIAATCAESQAMPGLTGFLAGVFATILWDQCSVAIKDREGVVS